MNENFNATHTQKVKVATEVQQKFSQIAQLNCQIMWYSMIYILYLILRVWGDTGAGLNGNRENQMVHRARDHDVRPAFVLKHMKIYELKLYFMHNGAPCTITVFSLWSCLYPHLSSSRVS